MQRLIGRFNGIASKFPYFQPIGNVYESAEAASEVISLNAQFGEGWLLPGEVAMFARHGVRNVVSRTVASPITSSRRAWRNAYAGFTRR